MIESTSPLGRGEARASLPGQRILVPVMIIGLALVSLLALGRNVQKTSASSGAIDLYPYWYYGHFVRLGVNPYAAFAEKIPLTGPVHYWDGSVVEAQDVVHRDLAQVPANTASTLLIAALLSYFPWEQAKYLWFVINVAMVVVIPWLALRLLPPSLRLGRGLQWLAALAFYAMKGQRVALANGQPSIFVFFFMLVTLLSYRRHWFWAGVALGIALGKYSLSLPLVLFLLLDKQFRVVLVGVALQGLSYLALLLMDGGSLWQIIETNWAMISHYTGGQAGLDLSALLGAYPLLLTGVVLGGTIITLVTVFYSWRRGWLAGDLLPVNSLLFLWTVLAAYHRVYDTMVVILFLILCLSAATRWQLRRGQAWMWGIVFVLSLVVVCLPGEVFEVVLSAERSEQLAGAIDLATSVVVLLMWAANLWLAIRVPRVDE